MAKEKIEELSTAEKVGTFVVKNKKPILICTISVLVILLGLVIGSFAISSSRENALVRIDDLVRRAGEVTEKNEYFDSLVADLKKEVKGKSYTSCKASFVLGEVYYLVDEYETAYNYLMDCYNANKEIYLAPIALTNAAACAENAGNIDKAIDCYTLVLNYSESGVYAKALFNLGRINLQQGNKELAKTYFELLISDSYYSEYAALAQNVLASF